MGGLRGGGWGAVVVAVDDDDVAVAAVAVGVEVDDDDDVAVAVGAAVVYGAVFARARLYHHNCRHSATPSYIPASACSFPHRPVEPQA